MRVLAHRRVALFLVAILAPSVVLIVLSLRLLSQETELREKRRADEHSRALEQVRRELLARVSSALPVLTGWIEGKKLVLPWERFRSPLGTPAFSQRIHQGEEREFAGRDLAEAARLYREAMDMGASPAQCGYARLLYARVLDKLGRGGEARAQFRMLLRMPADVVDEEGIPVRLHAAERVTPAVQDLIALAERPALPPSGQYILSLLAEKLKVRELQDKVRVRIQRTEQAIALQNDFPRLALSERAWTLYGEEPWLVNARAGSLVAVRARDVVAPLESTGRVHFLTGEWLGDTFPGLRVSIPFPEDGALFGLQRSLYYVALLLVAGATLFGGYLLWLDLRREVRMAELRSQFVSSVSHELKTPLTAIRMFAETLQMRRPREEAAQTEYLDTIVSECERLSRLVDGVLHFSKIEQGKKLYHFKPTRLEAVIQAAARTLQYPLAQQGFNLRVNVADELPPLRADADALEQAVLNLLSNAMKYSGDAREIELELRKDNGDAIIRVSDHGIGIAPEEQTRIFEKFYRAATHGNPSIPGTGLGLTLVAHIAKAHGGRVDVWSAPGKGSTFTLRLPLEVAS